MPPAPKVATPSYWQSSAPLPRFPKLDADLSVDVAVVGAGITGVTAAYLLKRAGRTVALIERERVGGVDSRLTTAHLTSVTDSRLSWLAKAFGREAARAVWDAGGAAIDLIVDLIRREAIACDFRWVPGYLHAPLDGSSAQAERSLRAEADLAAKLGIAAEYVAAVPFMGLPGVRFAHQALFHPLKYLAALATAIPGGGSHVAEHTPADEVLERPRAVRCGEHRIRCRYVIIATHTPLTGHASLLPAMLFQTKLYLYTSYALGARLPKGSIPEASYWSTDDPYYYLRVDRKRDCDYAIFGGEDHKTGQEPDTRARFERLERKFRQLCPAAKVDRRWSGQVIETNDGLPYIGETAEWQFAATGYSGNGMTFGTLGAMMAADAVQRRKNPWAGLFSIHRKKLRGGTWTYVKENADYPYYLVRDRLAKGEAKSLGALRRGQGKIVNLGGKKAAAYRADDGSVVLRSPVCTHLQCIVAWNDAERTWDCPCHGSRFKPTGEVISGPAEEPLPEFHPPGSKQEA